MSKFKAGDLALIVDCILPELIGKVVELVEKVPPGLSARAGKRNWRNMGEDESWIITGDGLLCMTVIGNIEPDRFTLISEKKLMPLGGDLQPEREKSQEVPA